MNKDLDNLRLLSIFHYVLAGLCIFPLLYGIFYMVIGIFAGAMIASDPNIKNASGGAVFGGIFIGLGVGLVIKGRASTGSTSVVGEIVAKKTKYKAAEVLLAIDATIMFASVFVYNDIDKSLYSMLSVYVGIRVLDIILTGRPSKKIVNIVSNNVEVLKEQIRERIEEHGTILTGIGLHQGQNKTIIYVTVDAGKIDLLKNLITKYDPDAFMIITEASEFLGRGLK